MNKTYVDAHRLAGANTREWLARSVQVDGREHALIRAKDSQQSRWHALARHLDVRRVNNLERFVHAQYRYSVPRGNTLSTPPNITSFMSEQSYDRYADYHKMANKYMAQKLESAHLEFECLVGDAAISFPDYSDRELWNFVLMNKMYTELSPLFRYCVAASVQSAAAVQQYRSSALEQYLLDPMGYSQVWDRAIPKELNDEAIGILMFDPRKEPVWK